MNKGGHSQVDSCASVTQEIDITEEDDMKTELCNMCKETPNVAAYECLACRAFCCHTCGKEHTRQPRFSHHRLIPLHASFLCPRHNQELILYCFECMRLCCLVCGHFSPDHFGHKLLDIDSAHEQLEPFIHELFSKLEDVKTALKVKEETYLREKTTITSQINEMRTSMTAAVKELTKTLTTELDHLLSKLDLISAEKLLRLDFELTKTQDLKSQIEKMTLPSVPKDRLLVFLPQAKNLIAVPIHPAEEFSIDNLHLEACRDFLTRTDAAMEAATEKLSREEKREEQSKPAGRQFGKSVSTNDLEGRNHASRLPKQKHKEKLDEHLQHSELRPKRNRKKPCLSEY